MQYDADSPLQYLDALEEDWRKETLMKLREMIQSVDPELKEGVEYKMLSFGNDESNLFHLNAQKAYVSLYVGNISKIDKSGELLDGLSTGKGCIRFSKSVEPADTRIDEFIERAVQIWKEGGDTSC
jgi:uncharacterized protein YdhG (YjbR/CyaY superfamily)